MYGRNSMVLWYKVMFNGKFKLKSRQSLLTNVTLFHLGANKWSQALKFRTGKKLFILYYRPIIYIILYIYMNF